MLELFCCTLYLVHRSLFNQAYCFELIQSGFDVALYFHASSAAEYEVRVYFCGLGMASEFHKVADMGRGGCFGSEF